MNPAEAELMHDLRMPIQLILMSAEMLRHALEEGGDDPAPYLDMLTASANQARRMVAGALPEGAALFPRREDAAARVRGLCLRCGPEARAAGVRLECAGNVDSLEMMIDGDALERVLMNLIANALRFTPPGGTVKVTWTALGDCAEIAVTDTGTGIPPERLPFIFLRGETDGGHGLGLPIARDLARRMGGDLTAASLPGRGSTFTLRLPVAGEEMAAGM